MLYEVVLTFKSVIEPWCVTIQIKAIEKYFHVVLFISGAPKTRRAAKWSPITIGKGSRACIEIETHATLFSW